MVKKYLTLSSSFLIMLCLGSVYAWSIMASELTEKFNFAAAQTQLIFGALIAIFPATMIFANKLAKKIMPKNLGHLSGILFLAGYVLAGFSNGNFLLLFSGISILAGLATGLGYWVALTVPVQWFPGRKGLVTGISAAGFGLGAYLMSVLSEIVLSKGASVFHVFSLTGLLYGTLIVAFSTFIFQPFHNVETQKYTNNRFLLSPGFIKLFFGIFAGTFSGLLVIGNLKLIGGAGSIPNHLLIAGISLLAVSNFFGRLIWGFLSDYVPAALCVFLALALQSVSIFLFSPEYLNHRSYIILSALTGFGFGGNFVLFAKETTRIYGTDNLGRIYPYVFLGYALAGISGPISGGLLFDFFNGFTYPVFLAALVSFFGSLLFLYEFLKTMKSKNEQP
ncbi:MAG: MFS transporter [Bacteroidales bacterium]|nr:MFS transporter [Bacteroidales bacterium]